MIPLKFKIICAVLFCISLIMVFTIWRDMNDTEELLFDGQKKSVLLLSDGILNRIMVLMLENKWQDLQTAIDHMVEDFQDVKVVRIFLPETGEIIASAQHEEIDTAVIENDLKRIKRGENGQVHFFNRDGGQFASKLTLIKNQPACHRCHAPDKEVLGVLDIGVSLSGIEETIGASKRKHIRDALFGFLIMGGAILLAVWVLIDRPVSNMIRTIHTIQQGDLSARMEEGSNDELGLMAQSFNRMLASVESANHKVELCHAEQMERAAKMASLGEIISGMAHEIKNPLAGISCAVQVLQSDLDANDDRRAMTTDILQHIRRLDNIVKSLLNYARPNRPQLISYQVRDVIDKTVFFIYPEAKKQQVTIDTEVSGEVPPVMMDADQMQQVFLNLMINALQAMPDGGYLKIILSETEIDTMEAARGNSRLHGKRAVTVTFADTGEGIDTKELESIFEPFMTKKSQGTGLGLSISQRIVQEHGGEITVESEVGAGSTFTVYLPETENA